MKPSVVFDNSIHISSKLSGTYQSAVIAKKTLEIRSMLQLLIRSEHRLQLGLLS
ncbi:DegV family protein [Anaerobacillus sp. HL2]|nr:DegV family protein [Anaerobacillus sp. HL2]